MVWALCPFWIQNEEGIGMTDELNFINLDSYDMEADASREIDRMKRDEAAKERNTFKCHCNYHHGMGPNIQCPVHGSRENLFAGVVSRRHEIARLEKQVERLKKSLHARDWDVNRMTKLLNQVSDISDSRVIKSMIKLGLEPPKRLEKDET